MSSPTPHPSPPVPTVRVAVAEVGATSVDATAALRALRDAGHEVVYVGVLAPDLADLALRLAAVCVQEDVDALVLLGDLPPGLTGDVRDLLAAYGDPPAVLTGGAGLTEQVARCARRP